MQIYIDCDGVLFNTNELLKNEYNSTNLTKEEKIKIINWQELLKNSLVLDNSINIIKKYNYKNVHILTKIHTIEEAEEKLKFLRKKGLRNCIIFVPKNANKTDIVNAKKNILVDDDLNNLLCWKQAGGISIYYGKEINEFPKIKNLEEILNSEKLQKYLEI